MFLGKGADPSKGPCRKAKEIRRERKAAKLVNRSNESHSSMEVDRSKNAPKSIEEFLNEKMPDNPAHKLEVCFYII